MKKRNLNFLLVLLAALALVFAFAGCADNGAGDAETPSADDGNTPGTDDDDEEVEQECCDTAGCTQGSSCNVCDDCETCLTNNCCGDDACAVEECTNCTGGKECTGNSSCTACADAKCDCEDCTEAEATDYAASYYSTEWSATAEKATANSAMSLTKATLSFGNSAENATLELTIMSDNDSYSTENYSTWTLSIDISWSADENGVTVTLPNGESGSNVTALNLVADDKSTLRLDSVTKSDANDASYIVSFSDATEDKVEGGGAATSSSTADLFDLTAGSLVAGVDGAGTEFTSGDAP